MEMQQVRYFVALAGTLNFTRAAEQCNVSQPALTRAIQQLEHELGGPLFHRERGNTHLSELGRMMLPYLQTVEESTRAARDHARAVKKLERATLTIGTMCTIGPQLVSDLLIRFRAQHPDVEVQFVDAGAPQMIEMLEKGELEVAIVGVPGELPESLHQLPIFEERFVIVLPPNHRLVAHDPVRAAELDKEPYVSRSNCEVFEPVRAELNSRGVFLRQVFSSPRDDWVQGMIKAGPRPRLLPRVQRDRSGPGRPAAGRAELPPDDLSGDRARPPAFAGGRRIRAGSAALSVADQPASRSCRRHNRRRSTGHGSRLDAFSAAGKPP